LGVVFSQFGQELETIHGGHVDIHDAQVGVVASQDVERLRPVRSDLGLVAGNLHGVAQ